MGEFADIALEQAMDEYLENDYSHEDDEDDNGPVVYRSKRKLPTCKFCHQERLLWKSVSGKWILFNNDSEYHTCNGYTPPKEILQELLNNVEKIKHEKYIRRLCQDECTTIDLPYINSQDLIDVYTVLIKKQHDELYHYGYSMQYSEKIKMLKTEILNRLNKIYEE